MKKVLLVCGSGASTGFMASSIRKAVKNRQVDLDVEARSDSEIENYLDDIDCLMIGPHLKYLEAEISEQAQAKNVKVALMDPRYYSVLDGEQALDHILAVLNQ